MDPELDAIYIALPHSMHKKYTLMAMNAKISALCEKPAALSLKDTEEMIACALRENTFFMEAMKTRFVPAINQIKEELNKGMIGEIRRIQAGFGSEISRRSHMAGRYIENPLEGGALYDLGPYPVSFLMDFMGDNIVKIEGSLKKDGNRPEEYRVKLFDGDVISGSIPLVHDDMFGEIEEVHRCLNQNLWMSRRCSWDDTLRTMKILEKLNS